MKKKPILLLVFLILLTSIYIISFLPDKLIKEPVHGAVPEKIGYVNGEPVVFDEFQMVLKKNRSKEEALKALIRIKVIQIEAMRSSIIDSADYASFIVELQEENMRRQKALNNKERIFGPQAYSAENYYDYKLSDVVNRLAEHLFNTRFEITEDKLMEYFHENIERLGKRHDIFEIEKIMVPIEAEDINDYGRARQEALSQITEIYHEIEDGLAFDVLYANHVRKTGWGETESIHEDNYREVSKLRNGFYQALLHLKPYEISQIIEDRERFVIIRCFSREDGGFRLYEDRREEVKLRYKDQLFNGYIEGLVNEATVELISSFEEFNN